MSEQEFEYIGFWAKVDVRESGSESATGVFSAMITVWPDLPTGSGGQYTVVERGGAHIYLSESAADAAAAERARIAIDNLIG